MAQNNKNSGNDLRIVYILGGIIIVALAYFFGFAKLSKSASAIADENEVRRQTVDQLNAMVAQKDQIISITNEDIEKTEEIAKHYPEKYEEEKELIFLQDVEDESGIIVTAIAMTTNADMDMSAINATAREKAGSLYKQVSINTNTTAEGDTSGETTAEGDASEEDASAATATVTAEAGESDLGVGRKTTMEVGFVTKYDDIRSALDYLYSQEDKVGVSSISLQYDDQTGKLAGTMKLVMYSMEGIGHEYVVPAPHPQDILPPLGNKPNMFRSK